MRRSDSIQALAKALVLAKKAMEAPTKNKVNPHFKSAYADLGAVKSSYQTALGEAGLSVVGALSLQDTVLTLTTTVVHAESGEFIASDFPIPAGLKAQEIGSAISYGRRYNVCSLLDIVAEDDDDGNAAQNAKAPKAAKEPAPAPASSPQPVSALTQEETLQVGIAAKLAGYPTPSALAPILENLFRVKRLPDLARKDLPVLLDALNSMAAHKVSA